MTTGWRVYLSGVAFGLACSFKVWALIPAAIVFLFAAFAGRGRVSRFLGGLATGVAVIFGPFAVAAGGAFFRDVFAAQVNRILIRGVHQVLARLRDVLGLRVLGLTGWATVLGLIALVILVALAHYGPSGFERGSTFDRCVAVVSLAALAVLSVASPYFGHYAFLVAPWLAMIAGSVVARALTNAIRLVSTPTRRIQWARAGTVTVISLTLLLGTVAEIQSFHVYKHTDRSKVNARPLAAITALPASSCVLTDQIAMVISANRLREGEGGCPLVLDSDGIMLIQRASEGTSQSAKAALARRWQDWFERADYVYLTGSYQRRIPWTNWLERWFDDHFVRVHLGRSNGVFYKRI